MSESLGAPWPNSADAPAESLTFASRKVFLGASRSAWLAVQHSGARHFLVQLADTDRPVPASRTRGLLVRTIELAVDGAPPGRFLDIQCADTSGFAIFDALGVAIRKALEDGHDPIGRVNEVLKRWRRFWGSPPSEALSEVAAAGLFAEVWFLGQWLAPAVGMAAAVDRWKGPSGSRHDFEWLGGSVEAKASRHPQVPVHTINGIEQLSPPETGPLYLFSLRLRAEAGASHSLNSAVETCRRLAEATGAGTEEVLNARLLQAGYVDIHAVEYDNRHYRIVEEGLYHVTDGFPRLIRTNLTDESLPPGVGRIEYDVHLAGFERFRVATNPHELPHDIKAL